MKATKTKLLDWQQRYGTEDNCAQALAQQAGQKDFAVHSADTIMATPSPLDTVMNVVNVITKPHLRQARCFTPLTYPSPNGFGPST